MARCICCRTTRISSAVYQIHSFVPVYLSGRGTSQPPSRLASLPSFLFRVAQCSQVCCCWRRRHARFCRLSRRLHRKSRLRSAPQVRIAPLLPLSWQIRLFPSPVLPPLSNTPLVASGPNTKFLSRRRRRPSKQRAAATPTAGSRRERALLLAAPLRALN